MSNPAFSTLVATTLQNYMPRLADNITNKQALWYQLKERGFVTKAKGGTSIVEPLMVGRNNTVKSYSGYDIIDTSPQQGLSAAEYLWKQIAGSLSISGEEKFKNSGKSAVISLLDSRVRQLELSMMMEINRQLQADGLGNSGKDLTGLALQVEEGTAWSSVGGIDSNAFPYWRNQWDDFTTNFGGALDFVTTDAAASLSYKRLIRAMTRLYTSCMRNNVRPTLILTDQMVYEAYGLSLTISGTTNFRIQINQKLADAGFMNLLFMETPVVIDDDMPNASLVAGADNHEMLFLNADFLRFVIGEGKDFVNTPMMRPDNQDAETSQVLVYGNLTCSNRQRQGRLTNIDFAP